MRWSITSIISAFPASFSPGTPCVCVCVCVCVCAHAHMCVHVQAQLKIKIYVRRYYNFENASNLSWYDDFTGYI